MNLFHEDLAILGIYRDFQNLSEMNILKLILQTVPYLKPTLIIVFFKH
jgi:hypothetical protein